MVGLARDWELDFREGRAEFMAAPHEQFRHAVIASLIESYGRGEVCDLGCGEGNLLRWLRPHFATRYIGVDVSATAVGRIASEAIPVETAVSPIETYAPPSRPLGSLVCAEALYYLQDQAGAHLARIAASLPALDVVIVSLVSARPDKPNWGKGSAIVQKSLDATGWPCIEQVEIKATTRGIGWQIAAYRPDRVG